jgi:hypothetical protein
MVKLFIKIPLLATVILKTSFKKNTRAGRWPLFCTELRLTLRLALALLQAKALLLGLIELECQPTKCQHPLRRQFLTMPVCCHQRRRNRLKRTH